MDFRSTLTGGARRHLTPVQLDGAKAQSQTTIHGWPSFFLGTPFALVGLVVVLTYTGHIPVSPEKINGPRWIIGIFGVSFLLAGLSFMRHGIKGVRRKARVEKGKLRNPTSPWVWDHSWNRLFFSSEKWRKPVKSLIGFLVFFIFLAPFNWWAFVSDEGDGLVLFIVVIFDLVTLGIGIQFVYHLMQYFKYGESRLMFYGFPFYLGETLSIGLEGFPGKEDMEELTLSLRFIEEKYEIRGSGDSRSSTVVCYEHYIDARKLEGGEIPMGPLLDMQWPLPEDADFATELSSRPARFWELEAKAQTPGVDYHERFLIPVYAKST